MMKDTDLMSQLKRRGERGPGNAPRRRLASIRSSRVQPGMGCNLLCAHTCARLRARAHARVRVAVSVCGRARACLRERVCECA